MGRLIAAELRKLATTRLWLWLLLGSLALTALFASLGIAFSDDPENPSPPLSSPQGQQTILSVGQGAAGSLVAVLAAIGITGEYRHRTATVTFLSTPHRGQVVLAKALTYVLVAIGYGLACVALTLAIVLPWLGSMGIDVSLTGGGNLATLVGVVVAVALYALIGVGLGALLRDQVATVVALLVYLYVVEPVITRIPALGDFSKFLPASAGAALSQVSQQGVEFLSAWQGGAVLAAYGALLAAVGTMLVVRRDVT